MEPPHATARCPRGWRSAGGRALEERRGGGSSRRGRARSCGGRAAGRPASPPPGRVGARRTDRLREGCGAAGRRAAAEERRGESSGLGAVLGLHLASSGLDGEGERKMPVKCLSKFHQTTPFKFGVWNLDGSKVVYVSGTEGGSSSVRSASDEPNETKRSEAIEHPQDTNRTPLARHTDQYLTTNTLRTAQNDASPLRVSEKVHFNYKIKSKFYLRAHFIVKVSLCIVF